MSCPGSNPGSRGGNPATNRLSYDTALQHFLLIFLYLTSVSYSDYMALNDWKKVNNKLERT
jgi:hypothetical protein